MSTQATVQITPNLFEGIKQQKEWAEQQKRTIVWEKWYDPLGADLEEREWPGAIGTAKQDKKLDEFKTKVKIASGELPDDNSWNEDDYKPSIFSKEYAMKNNSRNNIRVIATAMGFMAITEHNRAGTIFNFWIGHTNFRLTRSVIEIIEEADGVESLDIYTPYRFRISVGKAFDSALVKANLLKNLKAEESILK